MSIERVVPHNLEAERSVLGSVLIDNQTLLQASEKLQPEMFLRAGHKLVFAAMLDLDRRRVAIDLVTLKDALIRSGHLDETGGPSYLASLIDGVPRSMNVEYYAGIVSSHALRRQLIYSGTKLVEAGYESDAPIEDIIARAESDLLDISRAQLPSDGYVFAPQLVGDAIRTLEALAKSGQRFVTGLSTGFRRLDMMTRGFQPGDLILLAARPSMGKSALATQIALNVASVGSVGYVSIEMTATQVMMRALAVAARVDLMRLLSGNLSTREWSLLAPAMEVMGQTELAIDESAMMDPSTVRSRAKRLAAQHPLQLLIVDYLQLLDTKALRADTREQAIAQTSRMLKVLAKELAIPVLVLCQLNRSSEARQDKRPQLSDLRESGALEQDGDLVLLLHRPEMYEKEPKDPGLTELIIAKQRMGPTGTVKLNFVKHQTRFEDWPDQVGERP